MSPTRARLRGGFLLYASVQFAALTTAAMAVYAGGTLQDPFTSGYHFLANFFSDLGATRAWSGRDNLESSVLFGIALGTVGVAFVGFAGAWRAFAFGRGRARAAGIASQVFGTTSGLAFVGIAVTPVNVRLTLHNSFVLAAFGLLLGYAACLTIVWWRNGATRGQRAVNLAYLVLVAAYLVSVAIGLRLGFHSARGFLLLVASQKVIAYASMGYVAFVTLAVRRQLAVTPAEAPAPALAADHDA